MTARARAAGMAAARQRPDFADRIEARRASRVARRARRDCSPCQPASRPRCARPMPATRGARCALRGVRRALESNHRTNDGVF
ncbi:cobalt-precorrin-6A reductase [Burkholderia thailandensis]|nr:cobalt-precorrin-6A reductase [Burkholderia thailandensis]KXF62493.1 cobalt-precorrin-6A reductase [Burkholderia thailandensis]PNE73534.1 cobalt-precorrin-6A reductase [Burkholderia thailandensis]